MTQNLRVSRNIEFLGDANQEANIVGNFKEVKKHFSDNFMGDTLDTFDWAITEDGTADSIAISEVAGGSLLITTGTVDNDSCKIASAVIYSGTKNAVCEARVTITDVSGTGLFVGFTDAKTEANGAIALNYKDDAYVTTADDAVGFVCDADSATLGASSLLCCGTAATVDAAVVDTGITWADGETKTLRVALTGTTADFFVDGVQKGRVLLSNTAATLKCFSIQAITRAADGSNTVYVSYVDCWQDL